ncbi:MAG: DUF4329 domain-containing protein [Pseudomonadota bacterium]|nr:DUF4329 domain-containing protein [Pseudomonadota bacterium]
MSLNFSFAMILAGVNMLVAGAAHAGQSSIIMPAQFTSETQAVIHAANIYNPVSVEEDREFMGIIFSETSNGITLYGYTVGAGHAGHDQVTVTIQVPAGAQKVAFWHTHGAPHWTRNYFSTTDTKLAEQWQIPIYLAAPDGKLRLYEPGDSTLGWRRARQLGLAGEDGASSGKLVKAAGSSDPVRIRA